MPNASRAHKLRHGLAVIAFAFSLPALADAGKAAAFYEDGLARFEKGDTAGAVIQLKNALQQNNKLLSAHVLLGRALLKQTELPAAEAAFNEAIKLGVSPSEVAVSRAELMLMLGRTKELLREIQPTQLRGEALVEVLSMRGTALADQGDQREALRSFQAAIDADPKSVRPYLSLVPVLLQGGEVTDAEAAVDRAMALEKNNASIWNLRASTHHVRGNLSAALADYGKALAIAPGHVDARVARASLLVDLRRASEAKKELDYLAEHAKAEPRSAYLRAVVAGRSGDAKAVHGALTEVTGLVDSLPSEYVNSREQLLMLGALAQHGLGANGKAKAYLDALLSRYPRNLGARKLLASIYMDEGDSARTLSTIEPVLRVISDDAQALFLAGRANLAEKRYRSATQYLERAAALMSNNAQVQAALGYSLIGGGDLGGGVERLEQAFQADPRNGAIGMVLASLYVRQGKPEQAVRVAQSLVDSAADDLAALNLLGAVRAASGDVAGASRAYEQVLKKDPEFVPAMLNLARIETQQGQVDASRARLTALANNRKNDVRVMYELGLLEQRSGNLSVAVEWFRRATAKDPNDPRAGMALVEALSLSRQPALALSAAKEIGLRHPDDLNVQAVLGQAYLAAGEPGAARMTFRGMTRIAEFDPDAQVRVGRLQLAAGFPDEAEYNVQKATTAVKDYPPALALAIEVALKKNDSSEAKSLLKLLQAVDSTSALLPSLEASVALAEGDHRRALELYGRAYDRQPTAEAALSLARAHVQLGALVQARTALERELKRAYSGVVARFLVGLLMQEAQWPDADVQLKALLRHDGPAPDVLNNLALVQLSSGDAKALETAEQALRLAPSDPLVIDTLGWIKLKMGHVDAALTHLRDARLRSPNNPEIRYHLAEALHKSGRQEAAMEELRAALGLSQDFPGAEGAKHLLETLSR